MKTAINFTNLTNDSYKSDIEIYYEAAKFAPHDNDITLSEAISDIKFDIPLYLHENKNDVELSIKLLEDIIIETKVLNFIDEKGYVYARITYNKA